MMTRMMTLTIGGLVAVALATGLTTGVLLTPPLRAHPASPPTPMSGQPLTHDEMHRMIDAMHGEGASERMHEAMPGSEEMMDQCAAMMAMMGHQQNQSMPDMMQRMIGR